jgi:pimeloyl-ACP methyl ester carboxylesterase/class 3 adenylate cyclase
MDRAINYAVNDGVHIAYQVVGDGPIDLVYTSGIWSNLEVMWEWPAWARYLERLASFSRLILFDMRGVGLSDRGPEPPYLELQMGDVTAVMDAVGVESAALFGGARGGAMTMLFAASNPERVKALVLYAPVARKMKAPDWPFGDTEEDRQHFQDTVVSKIGRMAGDRLLDLPGAERDEAFRKWWGRFERLGASPGAWLELADVFSQFDVRSVLPSIQAPTLVLHRTGDRIVDIAQGRAIAARIPGSRFVELSGEFHLPFLGDPDAIVSEVEDFLTGTRHAPETDRILATLLFTDLVASTEMAASIGDRGWRDLLQRHHDIVRRQLGAHRGTEVDTAGDGFMARFDGPARAVRCARDIVGSVAELGLRARAGLHTGECEVIGQKLAGIAVHIAARVAGAASPGQVLVSSTVKDLVAGSELQFSDAGTHILKGVPGEWRLFDVLPSGR